MRPTACFDKSFLQSLSVDESVWFDHYFVAVITPLFFVETLADLGKQVEEGQTPENEVGKIADKTPELNGSPTAFYRTLCDAELRGFPVPMDGRPVLGGGKRAVVGDHKGLVIEVSPEVEALARWRRREFMEVERLHAKAWRAALAMPVWNGANDFLSWGRTQLRECGRIEDVLPLVRSIVDGKSSPYHLMKFVFDAVGVGSDRDRIFARYQAVGFPPLRQFAPYTAHVLDVEIFCRFSMERGLIPRPPSTHRIDIAYLNYLPFCQIFISGDKIHRKTVPLFTPSSHDFVWGPDLKADLKQINDRHKNVPEKVREKGIHAFAPFPPRDGDFLTSKLWDRTSGNWRNPMKLSLDSQQLSEHVVKLVKAMRGSANAGTPAPIFSLDAADSLTIDRRVRVKKGSWYQLPKDLKS